MPIAIHRDTQTARLLEEPFKDEAELQACLERSPYLLMRDSEPAVATVQIEVSLPAAGRLDLLAVDKDGVPIAVEVKLARNAQSRREVVAQAFDYVADLSNLTFEELDDLVDGALTAGLQELVGVELSSTLRKQCATNLRAGRIRLVIAVDEAGEDLIRIVRYITDHSDIDVRLVCVSRFDDGKILVPRILVSRASDAPITVGRLQLKKDVDPIFAATIAAYDKGASEQWHTRGNGRTCRQIYPDHWTNAVHYEFGNGDDYVSVGLDLEHDTVRHLGAVLAPIAGREVVPGVRLEWDERWSRNRGRLSVKISKGLNPDAAVRAMQTLISLTCEIVEKSLKP